MRIGFGNDIHRLEPGVSLKLGGVEIPSGKGAVGHSDADALLHAVTDAILGALAEGDIGSHFPDNDERWRGADSGVFLAEAVRLMMDRGFRVANLDAIVGIEAPQLAPYIRRMRAKIAAFVGISVERVSVKAKSGEGVGPVGEGLAVKAEAVVLIEET